MFVFYPLARSDFLSGKYLTCIRLYLRVKLCYTQQAFIVHYFAAITLSDFNSFSIIAASNYMLVSMASRRWDLKRIFRCEGNLNNTEIVQIKISDGIHHFRPNVPRLPKGWMYLCCNNQHGVQSICACKSFEALRVTVKHWNCVADGVIKIVTTSFHPPGRCWFVLQTLHWRHNERDNDSNHHPNDCLLNQLFRRRWQKIWKLGGAGLCAGNSPVTGEFPAQKGQ